jgi:hypothetical protein
MQLCDKLKVLRSLEGNLRGLNRALSKSEVVRLIGDELGESISQAYLSQLESGKRPHMTEKTRDLLSRFYKVHPGFFVSDPAGFLTELTSFPIQEARLDNMLLGGAEAFAKDDPDLASALRSLADHDTTREIILLVAVLVQQPESILRLKHALRSLSVQDGGDREAGVTLDKSRRRVAQ